MIITQHIETGGIYYVHFTGLMKMDDGRWEQAVVYQRAPLLLKRDEIPYATYIRSKNEFKEKFKLLTQEEFDDIVRTEYFGGKIHNFDFRPTFSGIFS